MDFPNSLGAKKLAEIVDIVSMIRPPEQEAEYLLKVCPQDALSVAEECLAIMAAETQSEEIMDYWRKVCDCLRPLMTKH